jgi:hypothetical protein
MAEPTLDEREAFLWMQGRLITLLLRHDVGRFGGIFARREALPEALDAAVLGPYRDLEVVFYLRDELFDSILPRIKRRLSFVAPRVSVVEEPPARGRIDWARTVSAGWQERPGEAPLELVTWQRRRHFTTPENLFTVATVLEYQALVARLLDTEFAAGLAQAIRHPLNEIVADCTRELVFPQCAALVPECRTLLAGRGRGDIEDLAAQVAESLVAAHNSAYDDLLTWWRLLHTLRLLERPTDVPQPMLGADPACDNYLYQIWLFYEWGDLLQQQGRLLDWSVPNMTLRFTWGTGADACVYCLQHDRQIPSTPDY